MREGRSKTNFLMDILDFWEAAMLKKWKRSTWLVFAIVFACFGSSAMAWTIDETNRTVTMIGSHTGPIAFTQIAEPVHSNCIYGLLYFDVNTVLGKHLFATLTIAKTTGQKVKIGYTPPSAQGTCFLEMAALV